MSMNVYKAISAVQADLAKSGIGKDSENKFDGYKFRGIDAVYNTLSPLLAKHGLCILPRMISRACEERQSQKGGALFYVTVEAEFDFVSADDGSKHTVRTFGEAMDRGDKATNKAMSAAYKYAAFQAFAIPTEGDNDADASSHEVKSRVVIKPTSGAMESLEPEVQGYIQGFASKVTKAIQDGAVKLTVDKIIAEAFDDTQMTAFWGCLDSKVRSAIKKEQASRQAQAPELSEGERQAFEMNGIPH